MNIGTFEESLWELFVFSRKKNFNFKTEPLWELFNFLFLTTTTNLIYPMFDDPNDDPPSNQ